MSRSKWKEAVFCINLKNLKKKGRVKIWSRGCVISTAFLNKKVSIHNGKDFRNITINENHLGYKFGDFSFTCKKRIKKNSKKK